MKKPLNDQSADEDRKENVRGPTIKHNARRFSRVVEDGHIIAHRIFRFSVEALPIGNLGAKSLPGCVIFDDRGPDPRARRAWVGRETPLQAYDGAAPMDPASLHVQAP